MKYLLYTLVFFSINMAAQGLKFSSDEELNEFDEFTLDDRGYVDELASSYSLEKYVPPVISQVGGTCVGFSNLYYGLSTMYNIKNNYTSFTDKYANSFDPYFIYTIIHNETDACDVGLNIGQALTTLYEIGGKKLFYPKFLTCNSSWTNEELTSTVNYTYPYKIKNFYIIKPNANYVTTVKRALSEDLPVIIGVSFKTSLYSYNNDNPIGVKSDGLWNPKEYESIEGGHSMCVIGYDDTKFGGSFKVVNSWGPDYGDKGYVWIKYSDFEKYVPESYFIELNDGFDQKNYGYFTFSDPKYRGHFYEGQINSEGYYHGYGVYSFGDGRYLTGNYINGSREGWFYYINEKNDEYITWYKFEKNEVIDTQSLGFAELEADLELTERKEYFKFLFPNKKTIILNEDPDLDMSDKPIATKK